MKKIIFYILLLIPFFIIGCSTITKEGVVKRNSQLKEYKYVKKLIINKLKDTKELAFQLKEDALIYRKVREIQEEVIKRYPYSITRKIDDILVGIVGSPFTPLAIIGGIFNNEPDLIFFPLSAINPFKNFRPTKKGLLVDPITPIYEKQIKKSEWKKLTPEKRIRPLKYTKVTIKYGKNNKIILKTDENGVIKLNPAFFNFYYDEKIRLNIETEDGLFCTYDIEKRDINKLIIAQNNRKIREIERKIREDNIKNKGKNKRKEKIRKIEIEPGLQQIKMYKIFKYGYYVNQKGLPILALIPYENTKIYKDKNLTDFFKKLDKKLDYFYVFSIYYDPVTKILTSIKIGNSPYEKENIGWIRSDKAIILTDEIYRIKVKSTVGIYPTLSSALKSKECKIIFKNHKNTILPVIYRKGFIWKIIYFDENNKIRIGWVRWRDEKGIDIEIGVFKHKIMLILNYFEKNIMGGENVENLEKEIEIDIKGPILIEKSVNEPYFSSFNYINSIDNIYTAKMFNIPQNKSEYNNFQNYIISIFNKLLKNNTWNEDKDILFVKL